MNGSQFGKPSWEVADTLQTLKRPALKIGQVNIYPYSSTMVPSLAFILPWKPQLDTS